MPVITAGTKFRRAVAATALGLGLFVAGEAAAQSCQEDFGKLTARREAQIKSLNAMTGGGKRKLDPIAACPRLQALAAAERALIAYMEKNKDWCSIPDEVLANAKKGMGRTGGVAAQACKIAAQAKQMRARAQREAREGGGAPQVQRLPSGPL
jgi:hypothetical protein